MDKIKTKFKDYLSTYKTLSPEKILLFWGSSFLSFVFIFSALVIFNNRFLIEVPTYGGSIEEGIIGTPRFINPVLAVSDQDKDLTSLVYAGLTKRSESGQIILDMAESITESEDKLEYTVVLKKGIKFHNGDKLTSDDVIYTISLIQNPNIKSPRKIEWEGVSVSKKSDNELVFSLKKPFPLFMNILTVGIIPKNLWKNLTDEQFSLSDYNIKAIGSGPFMIEDVKTSSGIPDKFTLVSNKNYTLGRPYIEKIVIICYQNEKTMLSAFKDKEITRVHGISDEKIASINYSKQNIVSTSVLPRTFNIFFNPNKNKDLSDKDLRMALSLAINKKEIVDKVLSGYGKTLNSPYPFDETQEENIFDKEKARQILIKNKILKDASSTISITLTTANNEEMREVAEMIKKYWEDIGVNTTLAIYEVSDLNQSVIKDRDFEVLLFGSIVQNPSDLYAFWHSSQRNYPGLNISNYVSKRLDSNLETLREDEDGVERINAYDAIKKEFEDETPGIFIYSPYMTYITNDKVKSSLPIYSLDNSSRFDLVYKWYRYTEKLWPKVYNKNILEKLQNIIN